MWKTSLPLCFVLLAGCRYDMHDQPRYEPLQPSPLFADGRSSRANPEGTVARGFLRTDPLFATGRTSDNRAAAEFPFPITRQVLDRGEERFNIFCAPCHGYSGEGNGMIVQRGFTPPPSYYSERVRDATPGHIYDVITNGFGAMYSYANRLQPADRWAVAAYVKALQAGATGGSTASSGINQPPAAGARESAAPAGVKPQARPEGSRQ